MLVFLFKVYTTSDFAYYIFMFITTVALLFYGILYFGMSSLSNYVLNFIPSFNSSSIYLMYAALCTDDTFNDYNLISSQVCQRWYSFGWACHVDYMCNVYTWYQTHAFLSPWPPTDYSTMLCRYILQYLLLYYLEYIFFNWLPYCYILYNNTFILPWYMSLLFLLTYLLITRKGRRGCYPGLTSGTQNHDWELRLTIF